MDTFALLRMMEQLRGRLLEQQQQEAGTDGKPAPVSRRSKVAKEEAVVEGKIVRIITSGQWDSLQPNTGKSVAIGDHYMCVGFREEPSTGYRTWEWHGHLILYDEEKGYTPEYIYGNFFQLMDKKSEVGEGGIAIGVGLGGIIDGDDSRKVGSILHRSVKK